MQLKKIDKKDIALLKKWLDEEKIYRWFGDGDFWLEEFAFEPESSFLVYFQENPIGFCRYTQQIPEEYKEKARCLVDKKNIDLSYYHGKAEYKNDKYKKKDLINNSDILHLMKCCCVEYLLKNRDKVYFIDYALCEDICLRKGYGKKMLSLLMQEVKNNEIKNQENSKQEKNKNKECLIFASSSLKNVPSSCLLKSLDFTYIDSLGLFAYHI